MPCVGERERGYEYVCNETKKPLGRDERAIERDGSNGQTATESVCVRRERMCVIILLGSLPRLSLQLCLCVRVPDKLWASLSTLFPVVLHLDPS